MPPPDVVALQLLVPGAAGLLDAARGLPGAGLLEPPHVSLGYPWTPPAACGPPTGDRPPDGALDGALDLVRSVAAGTPALVTTLVGPRRFPPDARGRVVVHAVLADPSPVFALAAALGAPAATVGTPHLSIARVTRAGSVDAVCAAVAAALPLDTTLDTIEVTTRTAGVWSVALRATLAG